MRLLLVLLAASLCAQEAHYRTHDGVQLNDLTYTPGAVSGMTKDQLCDPAFRTGTVRNVSSETKRRVCEEYGIAKEHCNGREYEIDHLLPIEVGGSNDIENLWAQPIDQARRKDVLENVEKKRVCHGSATLDDIQSALSTDWYAEYLKLGLDKEK